MAAQELLTPALKLTVDTTEKDGARQPLPQQRSTHMQDRPGPGVQGRPGATRASAIGEMVVPAHGSHENFLSTNWLG